MTRSNLRGRALGASSIAAWTVMSIAALRAGPTLALTDVTPYATVGVGYDSNVFARPAGDAPFAATGDNRLGDSIEEYLAGVDADFALARDRLKLNADVEHFAFNHFSVLDHNEYRFGGDFQWHLGPIVDGTLDYSQARTMTPLADTLATVLELQTEKIASATIRTLITPQWRLDLVPSWHELDTPLPDYPNFGLRETGGAVSVNYLGINKLTAGLKEVYTDGQYHQIVAATKYHQSSTELTADYAVTGLSSFDGQLGYTTRNSSLVNPADATQADLDGQTGVVGTTSAFTGSLGFRRQLSVKTNVYVKVFRDVSSYISGANSAIATGGDAGITWDPDVKFTVSVHYRQETDSIQGQLAIAGNFQNRTDHLHEAELFVKYHARPWLTLRPYVSYNDRGSNYVDASYVATIVGVDLTARWQ